MALFGGKKDGSGMGAPAAPSETPLDIVMHMRQQGYSNDQIIQDLQMRGYNPLQISDSLSQADMKGMVGGPIGQQGAVPDMLSGQQMMPPPPMGMQGMQGMPPPPGDMMMPPMQDFGAPQQPQRQDVGTSTKQMIEEVAEGIIDEKWEELMKSVDRIITWKDQADRRLERMEQSMKDLKERFESLNAGVLGKIEDYDKGIKTVGSDIKAMEAVFKKIIPSFTENVGKLTRVADQMEKTGGLKKKFGLKKPGLESNL